MSGPGLRRWVVAAVAACAVVWGSVPAVAETPNRPVDVIVTAVSGAPDDLRDTLHLLGGTIRLDLPLIDAVAATMPAGSLPALEASPAVAEVTLDSTVTLNGRPDKKGHDAPKPDGDRRDRDRGGKHDKGKDKIEPPPLSTLTTEVLGVDRLWRRGVTGRGIGVALIDSGVSPVEGVGAVFNGPDLSFDSPNPELRHLDGFGHGTHLAGIIAGDDPELGKRPTASDARSRFAGVAPGAHLVNVKVADAAGTADVSQVIYAIQWVVDNMDGEVPIDVLTLAFGTDGVQDPGIDPLAAAVEQAWHAGLVVVVAAGNDGNRQPLRNPASDPFVIAVGATDPKRTPGSGDDQVLDFSNCGTRRRPVDVLAPGKSLSSLRVPNSQIDLGYPDARDGERYFRGTGTSQAAAVVSGVVALMLDERPNLSPDEVKALLGGTADRVPGAKRCGGAGTVDADAATRSRVPHGSAQEWPMSDGSGTLEGARGSHHVAHDGIVLEGERDVLGNDWSGGTWSGGTWSGGTWSGGTWSGGTWSGGTWSGGTWSGGTWSGGTWSGGTWSGGTWSGGTWSGGTWSGGTWSGGTWSGGTWSVAAWR